MSVLYAQVIVDIVHENVAHTFTYRIPDGMTLTAGQRVEVPFGRMRKEGVVLSLTQETDVPPEKLRDILRPLEDYAAICPTLLTLAQQMADDVHCPLAETLRLMLPAQMRGGRIQVKTQTVAQAAKPREMLEAAALAEKRSPKRRLLLTVLSDGRTHPVEELKLLVREPLQALRPDRSSGANCPAGRRGAAQAGRQYARTPPSLTRPSRRGRRKRCLSCCRICAVDRGNTCSTV